MNMKDALYAILTKPMSFHIFVYFIVSVAILIFTIIIQIKNEPGIKFGVAFGGGLGAFIAINCMYFVYTFLYSVAGLLIAVAGHLIFGEVCHTILKYSYIITFCGVDLYVAYIAFRNLMTKDSEDKQSKDSKS